MYVSKIQKDPPRGLAGGTPVRNGCLGAIKDRVRAFYASKSGSIPIIFAMMSPILFGLVGAAVDVGRWVSARHQTLQAMDAAVLAAGRVMQLHGKTAEEALEVARTYYEQNKSTMLSSDSVEFELTDDGTSIRATSDSRVITPFLNVVGLGDLKVEMHSKANLAANGNAGTDVELAMMLDTTGSMGWGTKMADLKIAAKDLVDIVVWDDQSVRTARIALAPFSEQVNVGQAYYKKMTKEDPSSSDNSRTCIRERANENHLYTDKHPNKNRKFLPYPSSSGTCRTQNVIVPLTNDKDELKDAIDGLETQGGTAGHLGTAWAWYLMSDKFNRYWPDANDAAPYAHINETRTVTVGDATYEVPKLKKIAVLMTDGVYNRWYNGPDADEQAKTLCDEMKEKDIEIYTVGFEIEEGTNAYEVMSYCATSPDHFYDAGSGEQLRMAFRDIGLKVSTLRLAE